MRSKRAGFTLIELLVVITILGILAATLLPDVLSAGNTANVAADGFNLRQHHKWQFDYYKNKKMSNPPRGGHAFVLAPWVKGIITKSEENRDRFFTPGQEQDPNWQDLKAEDVNQIWRSFDEIDSTDTHYAGRARKHFRGMWDGEEALMANDNEEVPAFADGTINVLMASGAVRPLLRGEDLAEWWDEDDPGYIFPVGQESPIEMLQKLEH